MAGCGMCDASAGLSGQWHMVIYSCFREPGLSAPVHP